MASNTQRMQYPKKPHLKILTQNIRCRIKSHRVSFVIAEYKLLFTSVKNTFLVWYYDSSGPAPDYYYCSLNIQG